jgi:hypothetical protein
MQIGDDVECHIGRTGSVRQELLVAVPAKLVDLREVAERRVIQEFVEPLNIPIGRRADAGNYNVLNTTGLAG